jgi:hypothetical protein
MLLVEPKMWHTKYSGMQVQVQWHASAVENKMPAGKNAE